MEDSPLIKKAKALIQSVEGKQLSLIDRKEAAIKLAALLLEEAQRIQTKEEKRNQQQLSGMMNDPIGKVFTTAITDQCFRSRRPGRAADQLVFLIKKYGIPSYFPPIKKLAMHFFKIAGKALSFLLIPLIVRLIRKETSNVILPGEEKPLKKYMAKRRTEGVRVNLNHLGEAILGEEEAQRRLQIYLEDLAKPEVEYISIKISTIFSQINLIAWDETISGIAARLRQLYRAAMNHSFVRPNGTKVPKFINLDMEEYRDLQLTIAVFRKVLDEPEFFHHAAGIVLQSYLPDSYLIQQELTVWAMQRLAQGGSPIKIRIVKGANLAMEQFESAVRLWPQAPYSSKTDVDANFKRLVSYGCHPDHAKAAHVGIASHNLFDIAYAMLLRAENGVEKEVGFEMLEGMADHMRRIIQQIIGDMLLYCPAANKEEFQNAVAYLVRRLDENTAPDNFLRHAFDLKVGTQEWEKQVDFFSQSCAKINQASYHSRRTQNRFINPCQRVKGMAFQNAPDTDWSLSQNRLWAKEIFIAWEGKMHDPIPLVIGGHRYEPMMERCGIGEDPSKPGKTLYRYALATDEQIDEALNIAQKAQNDWMQTSIQQRASLLMEAANGLERHRANLIGAMAADTGKTILEADVEISEAIDFARYYAVNIQEWSSMADIKWHAKGTVLVAPPWNFPCSIPVGGITAALAAGNCVLFKPAPESVLVGWIVAQILWQAGVGKDVLQLINCEDEPVGSRLIQDPRVSAVILTGATSTAKLFYNLRPSIDLIAETGGKNSMVVTALSDRDLAIKDLVHSAFGHAGQKCSACSLAILEAEVYDDPHFRQQLRDAAASLSVGSPWDARARINPLIRAPGAALLRGLTELEEGEEWLLKPEQNADNPNLWSPGIKLGVKPGNFTFQTELFGPVLGLVRASSFDEALDLMNQTPYGLTAGIQSLDEREQMAWLKKIEAGNCYINRTITGAVIERQPFGGCKESSFGKGAKAGGPNYLTQLMNAEQISLPEHRESPAPAVTALMEAAAKLNLIPKSEEELWKASLESYAFYWNHYFSHKHDPCQVIGQDNLQCYAPHPKIALIVQESDAMLDILREIAAALTCGTPLEVITENNTLMNTLEKLNLPPLIKWRSESQEALTKLLSEGQLKRTRWLKPAPADLQQAQALGACRLNLGPVQANGRLELLNFLREVSVSRDYHRYGNLGDRENEKRAPLPEPDEEEEENCGMCSCHG